MAHSREDVLAAVRATFPKGSRTRAWEVLEEKLRQCVDVSKRDCRDALLLAECAEEAKLDTPEKRQRVRELFEKLGLEPPVSLWE